MLLGVVDLSLLGSEWARDTRCPMCSGRQEEGAHVAGCHMDQALSERGFCTQTERDAARQLWRDGHAATEPPP